VYPRPRELARNPCTGGRFGLLLSTALLMGCFSEPEPVGDSDGTSGCLTERCPGETEGASESVGDSATSTGTTTTSGQTSGIDSSGEDSAGVSDDTHTVDESTGAEAYCGDDIVNQPHEMCDGTPGCDDDCTFLHYACNPLTNAGCVESFRCGVADFSRETVACMLPGASSLGEACWGEPNNDSQCGDGLTCVFNFATDYCDAGNCCVEFCDLTKLTDPRFECSNGATCMPFWPAPMHVGLEHLGLCRT
jgi:hypothetical protein